MEEICYQQKFSVRICKLAVPNNIFYCIKQLWRLLVLSIWDHHAADAFKISQNPYLLSHLDEEVNFYFPDELNKFRYLESACLAVIVILYLRWRQQCSFPVAMCETIPLESADYCIEGHVTWQGHQLMRQILIPDEIRTMSHLIALADVMCGASWSKGSEFPKLGWTQKISIFN